MAMTVLVDGSDGYRAVFALAEPPDFTDHIIWQTPRTGSRFHLVKALSASLSPGRNARLAGSAKWQWWRRGRIRGEELQEFQELQNTELAGSHLFTPPHLALVIVIVLVIDPPNWF